MFGNLDIAKRKRQHNVHMINRALSGKPLHSLQQIENVSTNLPSTRLREAIQLRA